MELKPTYSVSALAVLAWGTAKPFAFMVSIWPRVWRGNGRSPQDHAQSAVNVVGPVVHGWPIVLIVSMLTNTTNTNR